MIILHIEDAQQLTVLKQNNLNTHTKHSRYLDPNILAFQTIL